MYWIYAKNFNCSIICGKKFMRLILAATCFWWKFSCQTMVLTSTYYKYYTGIIVYQCIHVKCMYIYIRTSSGNCLLNIFLLFTNTGIIMQNTFIIIINCLLNNSEYLLRLNWSTFLVCQTTTVWWELIILLTILTTLNCWIHCGEHNLLISTAKTLHHTVIQYCNYCTYVL